MRNPGSGNLRRAPFTAFCGCFYLHLFSCLFPAWERERTRENRRTWCIVKCVFSASLVSCLLVNCCETFSPINSRISRLLPQIVFSHAKTQDSLVSLTLSLFGGQRFLHNITCIMCLLLDSPGNWTPRALGKKERQKKPLR